MDHLKESFEEVAEWCERHLENKWGREIGMTFGAMLRAYGRLATLPTRPEGEECDAEERERNARAEKLLLEVSTRFFVACEIGSKRIRPLEPTSMRTNMTYDTGPRPEMIGEKDMSDSEIRDVLEDMGGWVRVFLGRGEPTGEVARFLSRSLTEWMRKPPTCGFVSWCPITRDGDTVELHTWYDQVLFPGVPAR